MNTELQTGNNHLIFLCNLPDTHLDKITERHKRIEQQTQVYSNSYITIDEEILKTFARRYATDKYTDENFLDSMLVIAKEMNVPRLTEAIIFVIENFCLTELTDLGKVFAKRPDAFSADFIKAVLKGDLGNREKRLLNYSKS